MERSCTGSCKQALCTLRAPLTWEQPSSAATLSSSAAYLEEQQAYKELQTLWRHVGDHTRGKMVTHAGDRDVPRMRNRTAPGPRALHTAPAARATSPAAFPGVMRAICPARIGVNATTSSGANKGACGHKQHGTTRTNLRWQGR